MSGLDGLASANVPAGDAQFTVVLPAGTSERAAVAALSMAFGDNDDYQAGRLYVGSTNVGVVERDTVLDHLETATKSFGEGDGLFLPGMPTSGSLIELRCPVAGCPTGRVLVVTYDEDAPPICPVHAGTAFERVA